MCSALMFGAAAIAGIVSSSAFGGLTYNFVGPDGLGGEAEFTLVNSTTLQVRLQNTSTGVPGGFTSADQLLTSIAFNLPGAISITGGTVFTGPTSASVNFDITNVGANADVSGEWGFGNGGGTGFGANVNYFSSNSAGAAAFGATNLDGPADLNGPQGGLFAGIVPLGGLGAIQDEVIATLTLSDSVANLNFLDDGIIIEFGSDAAFVATPAPGALALLGLAGMVAGGRRRRSL